ncbi:MAG: pantoate--beta-alanine ligase [Desulfobacteraceae bacterium]
MQLVETVREMQFICEAIRASGRTVGLVPTMGYFHQGHLELMRAARKHADQVVVSIFVNPIQFGPEEDLEDYPRDLQKDLADAEELGVDFVFHPSVEEMYPAGFQTQVRVMELTRHLCGLSRPGHFEGVATVVAKLFNITRPHLAFFGQKDYQQLTVVSRMARDLDMGVDIVGIPIVREPDGLAMSSRNIYLSPEERKSALSLHESLDKADEIVREGERDAAEILRTVEEYIRSKPYTEIDYVSLCHPDTLEDVDEIQGDVLLALAVRVGKARLIDNRILRPDKT